MEHIINNIKQQFYISNSDIEKIEKNFISEMEKGLAGQESSLKMIPSYVDMASGKEKGTYLAIDLGGTNLRVLAVELDGNSTISEYINSEINIPVDIMESDAEIFFGFIADEVKKFIINNKLTEIEYKLGFTFSFPVIQKNIVSGIIISDKWPKGFNIRNSEGKDVVELLQNAFAIKGITNIKINALCNDTIGALEAAAYSYGKCEIGVILGTGTNGCYREKTKNILKLENKDTFPENMLINIEWGNFDKFEELRTEYDRQLDISTGKNNQGKQLLEKMVSGKYLGELTRLVLIDLVDKKCLKENIGKLKNKPYLFKTKYMSMIEADSSENLDTVKDLLTSRFEIKSNLEDRKTIKTICEIVSKRAACISSIVILAVIKKIGDNFEKFNVSVDGALYEKHPFFKTIIHDIIENRYGADKVRFFDSNDGSGVGAAVIAALS